MTTLETSVKGLSELLKVLDQLPGNVERNIVRAGLLAGAKVVAEEARRIVRNEANQSGALADSIRAVTFGKYRRSKQFRGLPVAVIEAGGRVKNVSGKKTAFYAHMIENGTQPHVIKARRGGTLTVFGRRMKQVNHPGIQGIRFMARAGDTMQRAALEAFAARVKMRLEKHGLEVPDVIDTSEFVNEG